MVSLVLIYTLCSYALMLMYLCYYIVLMLVYLCYCTMLILPLAAPYAYALCSYTPFASIYLILLHLVLIMRFPTLVDFFSLLLWCRNLFLVITVDYFFFFPPFTCCSAGEDGEEDYADALERELAKVAMESLSSPCNCLINCQSTHILV